MKTIGVCGCFGGSARILNGQVIKTKTITEELKRHFGEDAVIMVDTYKWKKHPFKLFINCISMGIRCSNIIILPAHNGLKIFSKLFFLLKKLFKYKLHYIVIGGWLPEYLIKYKSIKKILKTYDNIYVETEHMKIKLEQMGFINIAVLPNCKNIRIIDKSVELNTKRPYKLCTFSRVSKEKGIEEAIEAVMRVNRRRNEVIYTLDIYGQTDSDYRDCFMELQKKFPPYVKYMGEIPFDKSTDTLKDYFMLLFPTFYEGEGFAGTIIDAFAAGLPVIASNWRYNTELVSEGITGFTYETHNIVELSDILNRLADTPHSVAEMRLNCINAAENYSTNKVMEKLIKELEI